MKHHIIVKYNELVTDKAALAGEIERLFAPCTGLDGIHGFELFRSCVDRSNRFDLMIVLDMDASALPVWDASEVHNKWKSEYGRFIAAKAIFDCE